MTATTEHPTQVEAKVDVPALRAELLGRYAELRLATRAAIRDPRLWKIEDIGRDEHRARVLDQLRALVTEHDVIRAFPAALGGADDHGGSLARFEELVVGDPSVQIKAGVQWGLFASAILHLGTARHHETILGPAITLAVPGAFAMTETGHGSDVAAIGTTATYDAGAGEFVVHTPFRAAWKDYLGNAALHGRAAVVFAQLITTEHGCAVNHGVHALYVPIRDEDGGFLPGIGGQDDGQKGGLNGIDNGRLWFDHVRVPRENLLNRYGDVAPDGTYSSPIASPGRRFFTMLGTLVQGRVSLDGAAVNASRLGLTIATTYANQRRQFAHGPEEIVLLDYAEHQRRLLPALATAYAQTFAHEELLASFDQVFSGRGDTPDAREELETRAAALKAVSTWSALATLQTCREACGGAGFLAENRITGLRNDLDVYVTFEGDNTVLSQLAAKRLVAEYGRQVKAGGAAGVARLVGARAAEVAWHRLPLARAAQTLSDGGDARRQVGSVRDEAGALLAERLDAMVAQVAQGLAPARKLPPDEAFALMNVHQHDLIAIGRAYAELLAWEAFSRALTGIADEGTRHTLTWLRDLYGLQLVERDLAWYLVHGRLSAGRARAVTSYIDRLTARLRTHAQDLVDAFGYAPEHLRAPIASGAEQGRQDEARAWYRAQRAAGTAPVAEARPARG
jgi:acyl-CoA oxidase